MSNTINFIDVQKQIKNCEQGRSLLFSVTRNFVSQGWLNCQLLLYNDCIKNILWIGKWLSDCLIKQICFSTV